MSFAVRSLPSTSGLDGAFRVHVLPEHLEQAGLKLGDLCEITDDNGTAVGYGVSWRATDKMGTNPKVRPAKMTETLRTAYGIRDGSHVMLHQTDAKIVHAEKVFLTDVTPREYVADHEDEMNDRNWRTRCAWVLCNSDVFATGASFDANGKKGLKKRYYIDHIESSEKQPGPPNLYYFNDDTQIVLQDAGSSAAAAVAQSAMAEDPISEIDLGGLLAQVQDLNRRLKRVLENSTISKDPQSIAWRPNNGILLHGFEGTGKSYILELLQRRLYNANRLDKSTLNSPSTAKNTDLIKEIFQKARTKQPSFILMDDINEIAPTDDKTYARTLIQELKSLAGTRVLVIATCRHPAQVSSALIASGELSSAIELPVPDQEAREQILRILIRNDDDPDGAITRTMSSKTHGFTGRDLMFLVQGAGEAAHARIQSDRAEMNDRRNGSLDGATLVEGNGILELPQNGDSSPPTNHNDSVPSLEITDFTTALSKVRPTALREIIFEPPKITWSDIGGSQDLQTKLDRIILRPFERADKMASYHKRSKKGVLLYGPPGCSKTLTAQAIATKYGLNFIAIKGSELISMYVGESERAVRELFRKARAAKPCVIFFDEIDSIASVRESSASKGLNVLTTLLNEIDGFDSLEGVLILAATNKPEALDPAIMRPGRFDAHFYLGLPDEAARKQILQIHSKGAPGADQLDFDKLACGTEGFTGAELAKIYDLASDITLDREEAGGDEDVSMADFDAAMKQTKRGVSPEMLEVYEAFSQISAGI